MKGRKINLTASKVDELMSLLGNVPDQLVSDHLPDDQFVRYSMEALDQEELHRADEHLSSCGACADQLVRLLDVSQVWNGEAGQKRLAALRERVHSELSPTAQPAAPAAAAVFKRLTSALYLAKEGLRALFAQPALDLAAPPTTESRKIWDWQSDDGLLQGRAILETNGDLTFRFSSEESDLEGARFYLRLGSLRREVVLRRVSETEVGAEVVIPRHERPSDATEIVFETE